MRGRDRMLLKVGEAYKTAYDGNRCYYCGDAAQTIDHAPPIPYVFAVGTDAICREGIPMVKVAACKECNTSILGDKAILRLPDRVQAVYEGLQRRHRKVLAMPNWEEDELEDFGYALGVSIEDAMIMKSWLERRLQYMEELHEL